jgi:hypothetical protein
MALAVPTAPVALRALTMQAVEAVKAVPITMADSMTLAVVDLPHRD